MIFIEESIHKNDIGIYGIKNKLDGNMYIGQTRDRFIERYWNHEWKLNNNSHDNINLQMAWNKYGGDNFDFIIIEITSDRSKLDELEIKYIAKYKKIEKCYNISLGGAGRMGVPISDHAKKIIGEKNRRHMLGKKHSEETKKKMSNVRKGRHVDRKTDVLDKETAMKIKTLLVDGMKPVDVAKEVGIDYKLVNNILSCNTWSSVNVDGWEDYRSNRKTYKRLTKKDHEEIYRLHIEDGLDKHELAKKYGKTVSMIGVIFRNQRKLHDNPVPSSE